MSTNQPPQTASLSSSAVLSAPSDPESTNPNTTTSPSTSSAPLILYNPPTFISIIRSAAINLFLPFVNGLMLGFGELFAHEIAFRLGWSRTNVFPLSRRQSHVAAPGVEVVENSFEKRRRGGGELRDLTSLE
ncbi:hypothetical protein TWF730_009444 [Orbilia blumenaviensis]|uniref:TOM13-domain-containing protein n=1 Tax=Orbilia blumenaviensis TaxID=1796055 RepID=A0AAV9V1E0_9PEZI